MNRRGFLKGVLGAGIAAVVPVKLAKSVSEPSGGGFRVPQEFQSELLAMNFGPFLWSDELLEDQVFDLNEFTRSLDC